MEERNDIYQMTRIRTEAEDALNFCVAIAHDGDANFMAKIQVIMNVVSRSGLLRDNFLEYFLILIARKRGIWRAKQDTDKILKREPFQGQVQGIELIERVLMSICMDMNEGKRFEGAKKLALDAETAAYTGEIKRLSEMKGGKIIARISRSFRKLFCTITNKN